MPYINWEYYNSYFPKLSQDDFTQIQPVAERKLDIYTHNRALTFFNEYVELGATDYQKRVYAQIKDAVCVIINRIYDNRRRKAGVTSVSNDGYSESFEGVNETDLEGELRSVAFNSLSGTGLMGVI